MVLRERSLPAQQYAQEIDLSTHLTSSQKKSRQHLEDILNKDGRIIRENDNDGKEFAILVDRAAHNLGIPDEVVTFACDTESINAFYELQGKAIAITRGLMREIAESPEFASGQITLSEDHVAAILAHEIEHAIVLGDKYTAKLDQSWQERLFFFFSHAEEFRADAQGMRRLAQAGYNPRAMIDVLKSFGLSHGRGDISHPEVLDRVEKLATELANDDEPIPNATKPYTPLSESLDAWIRGDSSVYDQTETLLHAGPQQLREMLEKAQTQREFWRTFNVWQETEKLSVGNAFLQEHEALLAEFIKNKTISVLLNKQLIDDNYHFLGEDGKFTKISEDDQRRLNTTYHEFSDYATREKLNEGLSFEQKNAMQVLNSSTLDNDMDDIQNILLAESYRKTFKDNDQSMVQKKSLHDVYQKLVILNTRVKDQLTSMFAALRRSNNNFSTPTATYLDQLHTLFQQNTTTFKALGENEILCRSMFLPLDLEYNEEQYEAQSTKAKAEGKRDPFKNLRNAVDLREQEQREHLFQQVALEMSARLVLPSIPKSAKKKLTQCIQHDTKLPRIAAGIISNMLFYDKQHINDDNAQQWERYIKVVPRQLLPAHLEGLRKLIDRNQMPLHSPLRKLHKSHAASLELLDPNFGLLGLNVDVSNDTTITTAQEIRLRAYRQLNQFARFTPEADVPSESTREDQGRYIQLPFTNAEIFALNPESPDSTSDLHLMLQRYCRAVEHHRKVDGKLLDLLNSYQDLGSDEMLVSPHNLNVLFRLPPWDSAQKLWEFVDQYQVTKHWEGLLMDEETKTQEIVEIYQAASFLYNMYDVLPDSTKEYTKNLSKTDLAAFMLDALQEQIVREEKIDKSRAFTKAFIALSTTGIDLRYNSLHNFSLESFYSLTDEQIVTIQGFFQQQSSLTENQTHFIEILEVLQTIDSTRRSEVTQQSKRRGYHPFEKVRNSLAIEREFFTTVLAQQQENSIQWLLEHFSQQTFYRDYLLVGLVETAEAGLQERLHQAIPANTFSPYADMFGHTNSHYPFLRHYEYRDSTSKDATEFKEQAKGLGFQETTYSDLLQRRYAFSLLSSNISMSIHNAEGNSHITAGERDAPIINDSEGSPIQRLQALQLFQREAELLDQGVDLATRLGILQEIIPSASLARDIYIEEMIRRELTLDQTPQSRITLLRQSIDLFTTDSSLRIPFAVQLLKDVTNLTPDVFKDFNSFKTVLLHFLPNASFARNYFLEQWENSGTTLTPDQLKEIVDLRLSNESKQKSEDSSPIVYIFNQLNEVNREQKVKTFLWLLNITNEKPLPITELEKTFDGHLDSLPKALASQTQNERNILFMRLLLGGEGVIDLQTVTPEQRARAEAERKEFLEALGTKLFAGTPNPTLFQNMFTTMIIASDPAHGAQVLSKLMNRIYEAELNNTTLSPAEAVTIALTEMGVVGKKIAQYIGELEWMRQYPEYQRALRKAQEEGPVVPRRAVMAFAEADGLLDPNAAFSIVEFGPSLGSASNKQANLVTLEVREANNSLGLSVGHHQLVYKVMRPSAQKGNLGHDLRVLTAVYESLPTDITRGKIPTDFLPEIQDTATRELDFPAEMEFNERMRPVLEKRYESAPVPITMPRIVFASDNGMLETVAQGQSLRSLYDMQENSPNLRREQALQTVEQAILVEALTQIVQGNFHVDLHPGNIFIDYDEDADVVRNITFIDWGMRDELREDERQPAISLLVALTTGDKESLLAAAQSLGWSESTNLALTLEASADYARNFSQNALALLTATQLIGGIPQSLKSLILALSKIEQYARHVDPATVFSAFGSFFV